jgi:hypothetical protein
MIGIFESQNTGKHVKKIQSSIVDNRRDYVLHYVGMSNMQIKQMPIVCNKWLDSHYVEW